jgi:YidC/Oxa1 family membrane protein insertase
MSPAQQKLMQYLPVFFAVFQIFFLLGLVIYYIVQALLRIAQQGYITKRFYGSEESLGRQAQRAGEKARELAKDDGGGGLFAQAKRDLLGGGTKEASPPPPPPKSNGARTGSSGGGSKRTTPSKKQTTPPKSRPTPTRRTAANRPSGRGKRPSK